ncbi:hypothetical protein SAMN05444004_10460 [Jannaschia faecimaris]|uniref:Uncharacterized protein n=1 Tax=Jannaschia faecimaris TaxID=1244108 RepID=A0A1H3NPP8_9RHOB|nr:hypothetical protein [Jannaschia faecimaris]SDY90804.1 hypothetical protein SAMN05444004_10460 [Jannaschia faecimaris]
MNFCFNGLKSGPICIGDTMSQLHGDELGMGHVGLGMLAVIVVAVFVFVFRNPA